MKEQRKKEIINSLKMCAELSDKDLENYVENLQQIGKNIQQNKRLKKLEKFFNLLGNDTRLIILKLLSQKSYCVCGLEMILDKTQSSISHHLRLLDKAGLIRGIKNGYFTNYEVVETKIEKFLNLLYKLYPSLKD